VDSRWNPRSSIGRTVLDLVGLPPLGVPRLDRSPSLIDLVKDSPTTPVPPAFGTSIEQPAPPRPRPRPSPPPPPPSATSVPVGPVVLRNGHTLPPPNDAPVH
jgi:hypothetical protein